MDSKWVQVLGNENKVVNAKKKQAAQCIANLAEVSHKAFLLQSRDRSKHVKRKRQDGSKIMCGVQSRKSQLTNYSNFRRSGLPERVLFYQSGEWKDFSKDIVELVKEEFKVKKAAIEVRSNSCHFMLDILYMIQVDLKTASHKPIAWIDESGGCFFPELHSADVEMHERCSPEFEKDEEFVGIEPDGTREINLHLKIELNGGINCDLDECVEESNTDAKRMKIVQKSGRLELGANGNTNGKHNRKVEEVVDNMQNVVANPSVQTEYAFETVDIDFVRKMFLEGMKSSLDVDILDINKCSTNMMQVRWVMFQKQAEVTQKYRGDPNIQYAWFAATKDVLPSILTYGLGYYGSKSNCAYGLGVHLTSVKCPITSANYCDIDENGVRHMVFCRVILGNVELVSPGSSQFHPSSETFDNGVDDLENPSQYIVWNMNTNTHIYPEYVVSFKIPDSDKVASLMGKEHSGVTEVAQCLNHPGNRQIGSRVVELEKVPSSGSSTVKTPKSPWMPFTVLFDAISPKVSEDKMNKLYAHYEQMKSKKLSREEFILKLRLIAGDELLKGSILGIQSKFPEKAKCMPQSQIGKC